MMEYTRCFHIEGVDDRCRELATRRFVVTVSGVRFVLWICDQPEHVPSE